VLAGHCITGSHLTGFPLWDSEPFELENCTPESLPFSRFFHLYIAEKVLAVTCNWLYPSFRGAANLQTTPLLSGFSDTFRPAADFFSSGFRRQHLLSNLLASARPQSALPCSQTAAVLDGSRPVVASNSGRASPTAQPTFFAGISGDITVELLVALKKTNLRRRNPTATGMSTAPSNAITLRLLVIPETRFG
jgi:hypothetical protein